MAASGTTPAARACNHWARPISDPSRQTIELLDMFWALNGATRTPRRANHRQMPAVTNDLPASEVVPATSSPPVIARPDVAQRTKTFANSTSTPYSPGKRATANHRRHSRAGPRFAHDNR